MGTIIGIVVGVLVLGAVLYFLTRGRAEPALPESTAKAKDSDRPTTKKDSAGASEARTSDAKAKKAAESAPAKAEPAAAPKAEKTEPRVSKPGAAAEPAKAEPRVSKPGAAAEPAKVEPAPPPPSTEVAPPEREPAGAPPKDSGAAAKERVAALKKGLATTRGGFIARLAQIFGRKKEIDPALLDEMQAVLITADIGPRTADKILERLRGRLSRSELRDEDAVWAALRDEGRSLLGDSPGAIVPKNEPTVIVVVGVNGVGKTTTIGKLASHFKEDGHKVVLAAGDTFRAAAVLQLEVWGNRVKCDVVKGKDRADPGSVVFDAVKQAKAQGASIVIADTAGRLHTKSNLMEELKKVVRTAEKALERPVDHVLLVLDATTGQNAIQQAQLFKEAIPISGIVLTKLDGTAKGGVVLGIVDEHHIPVRYIGIGERVEDLREFDADSFVTALFDKPETEAVDA